MTSPTPAPPPTIGPYALPPGPWCAFTSPAALHEWFHENSTTPEERMLLIDTHGCLWQVQTRPDGSMWFVNLDGTCRDDATAGGGFRAITRDTPGVDGWPMRVLALPATTASEGA